MWIKLVQRNSINEMIAPQYINGKWRKPAISGLQKAELKNYFKLAGVPWIYDKERPEVHMNSTYNRKPKGHKHEINFETRLAIIRKNLATQEEKLEKLRSDRIYTKEYVGYNRILASVAKALVSEENAAKYQ